MSAALWSQVLLRYDTQTLKQLTNVNTPGASSVNTTVGIQVATDAAGWFRRKVQEDYDSTNSYHNAVAVRAVYVLLREYSGKFGETVRAEREAVEETMDDLRNMSAGKRITPHTLSTYDPSDDENVQYPNRPAFDTERFDEVTPNDPPAP